MSEVATTLPPGYHPHNGGKRPLRKKVVCHVAFRNEDTSEEVEDRRPWQANWLDWSHDGSGRDIVGFKIVTDEVPTREYVVV